MLADESYEREQNSDRSQGMAQILSRQRKNTQMTQRVLIGVK